MPFIVQDRDLFKTPANWILQSGSNVNSVPSLSFTPSGLPDGTLLVTNSINTPYGGALLANKRPVPSIPGVTLNYVGLDIKVQFPALSFYNLARHEFDLKVCLTSAPSPATMIQNVADFSCQLNFSTGTFQIGAAWADTGIKPPPPTPDVWIPLSMRYWYDPVAKVCSVLSIAWNSALYPVPQNLQKVPFLSTNWSQVAAVQAQNEGFNPGVTLVRYDAGILTWSDQPF